MKTNTTYLGIAIGFAMMLGTACLAMDDSGIEAPPKDKNSEVVRDLKSDSINGWTCIDSYYDSNDGCDCGCGTIDPDCASDSSASCDYYYCPTGERVSEDDNSQCEGNGAPSSWTCNTGYYGSDDGCDCGCGIVDPDCESLSASVCDYTYCESGDHVASTNNTSCEDGESTPPPPPTPTDGFGHNLGQRCDERLDCNKGLSCDYQNPPDQRCNTALHPTFEVDYCLLWYSRTGAQPTLCDRSECLGPSHCDAGEDCEFVENGTLPNGGPAFFKECQPDSSWGG